MVSFLPSTVPLALSRKRWRIAFTVIYSYRAIYSASKKEIIAILRSPSYVSLDVCPPDDDSEPNFFTVDEKILSTLVKEKKSDQLALLGGVSGLTAALASDAESGIPGDADSVRLRKEAFGSNTYPKPRPKGFFSFVLDALKDLFIIILIACAVLSLAFGIKEHGLEQGWYDGASIFVAIFLVTVVSAVSNFRQDRRFDKLSSEAGNIQANLVRDGRRLDMPMSEIVVGDVVCLKIGDQVPADGLLLEGHSLQVDESSMTGESNHVAVDAHKNPFLSSGVKVADGYGRMLVTSVGTNTAWGEMMSMITRDTDEQTPLQERLQKLTSIIGKVGIAVAVVVFAALMIRRFVGSTNRQSESLASSIVDNIEAAVTIIVVAIPEGLPLAVTLTLAYSMKRMMSDNAMVRRLSAWETMGSVTTICTDKTGTLTMNQMTVTKALIGLEEVAANGGIISSVAANVLRLIHEGVGLNTTGTVYISKSVSEPEFAGSPTEKALLSWGVFELGMQVEELKRDYSILHVEAFNSEKKRSGMLIKRNAELGTTNTHWKGAAEMILGKCSSYYESNGSVQAMDEVRRRRFEQVIKGMAACSLRCIAFAYKQTGEIRQAEEDNTTRRLEDDGLTLLGLVGLKDPCRPGVKKAVEACRRAGVGVKMVTGDNVFTARAIAIECGILNLDGDDVDGAVVEGQEFRNYSAEERMEMVDRIRVMARSSPFDKLLMVQCLKQKGHVVAVTGDGTNDAPALKEADVGLSMGIQGTEVAKESSDVVILDDNFGTVVTVMRWGRCVYNNIQKFLQFQLTVNVAALVINFVSSISSGDVPLTTVQLLWVNLIMDTLGALALATERPTDELMEKPPVGRTEPLISNVMARNLIAQAVFQIAVLLTFQFKGKSIFGVSQGVNDTLIFNTFVLCQVFNEFNSRELEKKNVFDGIHKNKLFLGIVAGTLVLQVLMVELLKKFASTERLDWKEWGICVGVAALSWPIGWVVKCVPVSSMKIFKLRDRH